MSIVIKRKRGRPAGSRNRESLPDDMSFQSNPRLKQVGVEFAFTQDQIDEINKCREDPVYFIEKYVIFMTDDGNRTVQLFPFQKQLITEFNANRWVIVKTPRQIGKTTTTVGYILHYILFNKDRTVGVLAQKEKVATEILSRIKIAYESIPLWMQQGVKHWAATSIMLENGCRVLSESTSKGAIRGFTIHLLYLDEFAHVPAHIAADFITSVYPTISSSAVAKIIITSTPFGLNLFYKFWTDAMKEKTDPINWNKFHAVSVHWRDVPGRTQEWAEQQRKMLGDHKYAQDIEAEFLGSSNTLISGVKLRALTFIQAQKKLFDNTMSIYAEAANNHSYVLSADPSEGKGLDFSVYTVFDVTQAPYQVVAKFRSNEVEDIMFASAIHQAALHYNNAYVIVENNNIGSMVLHHLISDLDYDNCFYTSVELGETIAKEGHHKRIPGVRTSQKIKIQGCLKLKTIVESDQVILNDFDIVSELSTFVLNTKKKWEAEPGYYDDTCSTMWLFAWLTTQPYFNDISDLKLREKLYADREKAMEAQLPPQPILIVDNKPKPKLEISEGMVWIPAEVSYEDALAMLNGKLD